MTRLFVGNLPWNVTAADLRAAFAPYGPVSSADVVIDRSTGTSKGFGFVEMSWESHAVAAIQGLDGTDLKGRSMNVSRAHPRSAPGSRGNAPRGWAVVGDGRNRW
jgi:RNA recognition motif-containing protein